MSVISTENKLLTLIENKMDIMDRCPCLLSLNALCLSIAVDTCRTTKYFKCLLSDWRKCLPLGAAHDVNFGSWGNKLWGLMYKVQTAYKSYNVQTNVYDYQKPCYLTFKQQLESMDDLSCSFTPFRQLGDEDISDTLICSLRELSEVLMQISEFLGSPNEEHIGTSYLMWLSCYKRNYLQTCQAAYNKWKFEFSMRTRAKHIKERMKKELEDFKNSFKCADEFEQVFDTEQNTFDYDGLSRFIFSHSDRFGISYLSPKPIFSEQLRALFDFVETWRMMEKDLQPARKNPEKVSDTVDNLESKVMALVGKIKHWVAEEWVERLTELWLRIFRAFRSEIAQAGVHEKFKEFSKKKIYCIIGYLKERGVYVQSVTNVEITTKLEGKNNGMRKYVNNGLLELEPSLKNRIASFIEQELQKMAA